MRDILLIGDFFCDLIFTGMPAPPRVGTEFFGSGLEMVPLVIVRRGAAGALAQRGAQIASAPSIPVQVLDTTGAGDCFNAGFLYGHLRGYPLKACLCCGNICGGLSTTASSHAVLPTAAALEAWLARDPAEA